jgi:hypothetical protein
MVVNGEGSPTVPLVGVLARFVVEPGRAAEIAEFFRRGRLIVETQPPTTGWCAFQIDATTFGAFAVFADDGDRQALLAGGGPRLSSEHAALFVSPPSFEEVDLLEVRQPRA